MARPSCWPLADCLLSLLEQSSRLLAAPSTPTQAAPAVSVPKIKTKKTAKRA